MAVGRRADSATPPLLLSGDTDTVSRQELLPALALWKELAQQKDAEDKQLLRW